MIDKGLAHQRARELRSLAQFLVIRKQMLHRESSHSELLPDEDFPERGNNNQASKQNHEQAE